MLTKLIKYEFISKKLHQFIAGLNQKSRATQFRVHSAELTKISPAKMYEEYGSKVLKFLNPACMNQKFWNEDNLFSYQELDTKIIVTKIAYARSQSDLIHSFIPEYSLARDISILLFSQYIKNKENISIFLGQEQVVTRTLRLLASLDLKNIQKLAVISQKKNIKDLLNFHLQLNKFQDINQIDCQKMASEIYLQQSKEQFDIIELEIRGSSLIYLDVALSKIKDGGIISLNFSDFSKNDQNGKAKRQYTYSHILSNVSGQKENNIRLIYARIQELAQYRKKLIKPIYNMEFGMYIKIYFSVETVSEIEQNISHKLECNFCQYNTLIGFIHNQCECPYCGNSLKITGPFWSGSLYDKVFLKGISKKQNLQLLNSQFIINQLQNFGPYEESDLKKVNFKQLTKLITGSSVTQNLIYGTFMHHNYKIIQSPFDKDVWATDAPHQFIVDFVRAWIDYKKNKSIIEEKEDSDTDDENIQREGMQILREYFLTRESNTQIKITETKYQSPFIFLHSQSFKDGFANIPRNLYLSNLKKRVQ